MRNRPLRAVRCPPREVGWGGHYQLISTNVGCQIGLAWAALKCVTALAGGSLPTRLGWVGQLV